jgi:murein DD-endopeptidase MepM/ murein hydrolase activator NlpD
MRRRAIASFSPLLMAAATAAACNFPLLPFGPARQATAASIMQTIDAAAANTTPIAVPSPATAVAAPAATATPDWSTPGPTFEIRTASGDTLEALAARFGVEPWQILPERPLLPDTYLSPGLLVRAPNTLGEVTPGVQVVPDGAVVYGPSAAAFDVATYVELAGGLLADYQEEIASGTWLSGAAIVQKVADELSVHPQLLLALIEFRSGWVFGVPADGPAVYPLGYRIAGRRGLYQELMIAATQLNRGYYGWREGTLVGTRFADGTELRFHPALNPGSVAVMHLLATLVPRERWTAAVHGSESLPALLATLFGDPWSRAAEPVRPPGLAQPLLELPFAAGERWSLTGGPHSSWNSGTPRGALDFSPTSGGEPCAVSPWWATAAAAGSIVRSDSNTVALDLDGDGLEQTGWVIVYLHLARNGLVSAGTRVESGTPLGHPSCEGGRATGKHIHIARKFNGEWLAADGPLPFVLSGWTAVADERNYYGSLVNGAEVVTSDSSGQRGSTISR